MHITQYLSTNDHQPAATASGCSNSKYHMLRFIFNPRHSSRGRRYAARMMTGNEAGWICTEGMRAMRREKHRRT